MAAPEDSGIPGLRWEIIDGDFCLLVSEDRAENWCDRCDYCTCERDGFNYAVVNLRVVRERQGKVAKG